MEPNSAQEYEYLLTIKEELLKRIREVGEISRSSQALIGHFDYTDKQGMKHKPPKHFIYKTLIDLEAEGFITTNVQPSSRKKVKEWKDVVFEHVTDPHRDTVAGYVEDEKHLRDCIEHVKRKASFAVTDVVTKEEHLHLGKLQCIADTLNIESGNNLNKNIIQPLIEASFTQDSKAQTEAYKKLEDTISKILCEAYSSKEYRRSLKLVHLYPDRSASEEAAAYAAKVQSTIEKSMNELPAQAFNIMKKNILNHSEPCFVEQLQTNSTTPGRTR